MKTIFIETDLEGISGVYSYEQLNDTTGGGYNHCCERLMADVNAAIRGAFDAGADEVLVEDGHGGGRNFIPGMLDPRVRQVTLDDGSYDPAAVYGLFQIGAHAMSGTLRAFLDHTQSSVSWHDYYINGRKCGGMAQTAAFFGAYGVPFIMMSGDETACTEARQFFGDIETAAVKRALCRNEARCLDDETSERLIYEAAYRALNIREKIRPFTPIVPVEIKVEFNRADYCDYAAAANPSLERLDARTVRRIVPKIGKFSDLLI